MNNATITNHGNGGVSFVGPEAVEVFRLVILKNALKLEIKCPGIQMSRGMSALRAAKGVTGLKSNKREVHLAKVEQMIVEAQKLVNVPEPTNRPA